VAPGWLSEMRMETKRSQTSAILRSALVLLIFSYSHLAILRIINFSPERDSAVRISLWEQLISGVQLLKGFEDCINETVCSGNTYAMQE